MDDNHVGTNSDGAEGEQSTLSRRTVVGLVGSLFVAGLAGCAGESNDDGDGSDGSGGSTPTRTKTPTDGEGTQTGTPSDVVTPQQPDIDPPDDPDPLDPGQLQTYRNDPFGYSIRYPGNWSVDESGENDVVILAPDEKAGVVIQPREVPEPTESFDEFVQTTVEQFENSDGKEVLGTERVSLPNDRQGTLIDMRITNQGTVYRNRTLIAQRNENRFYLLQVVTLDELYTDEFDQLSREILTSFTINE